MAITIKLRSDTKQNWLKYNPTLAKGEMGLETDTRAFKFGDGITPWEPLEYASIGSKTLGDIGRMNAEIVQLLSATTELSNILTDVSSIAYTADESITTISSCIYDNDSGILKTIDNLATTLNNADSTISNKVLAVSNSAVIIYNAVFGFNDEEANLSSIGLSGEVAKLTGINYANAITLETIESNLSSLTANTEAAIETLTTNLGNLQYTVAVNDSNTKYDINYLSSEVSSKSSIGHTHEISDVVNLQNTINSLQAGIDSKVDKTVYTNKIDEITTRVNDIDENISAINTTLSNTAEKEHDHFINEISGLSAILDTTVKITGENYNIANNFIGIKDVRSVENSISADNFTKKVINIVNEPENYTDESLEQISSSLSIYTDGLSFTKNGNTTNYSLDPVNENQLVVKKDITKLDNVAIGKNITITHPDFTTGDSTWNIATDISAEDGTTKTYQVYFRQDIDNILSDISSYKDSTRLISDTEVYNITNTLSHKISNLDTRVNIVLQSLERYDELSANVSCETETSDDVIDSKAVRYIVVPLANTIDENAEFDTECYDIEAFSISTTDGELSAANSIFKYYDYNSKHVCAAIYIAKTVKDENNTEHIELVRLARSSNSFILKPETDYTFIFEGAITLIKNNTVFIGFEMVQSEEKIDFPVNSIVRIDAGSSPLSICLNESQVNNFGDNTLSVPSVTIGGRIVKDIIDVLVEHVNDVSAEIYNNIAVAVENLTENLETVSSDLYTDLTSTSSELYTELTSTSSELYNELTSTSSELYTDLTLVSSDLYTDLTSVSSDLYTDLTSVSSDLYNELTSTSSELYTDLTSVSSDLYNELTAVSSNLDSDISSLSSDIYTYLDESITTDKVFFKENMMITNTFGNYIVDDSTGYYIVSCKNESVQAFLTGALVQRQNPPMSDDIVNKPTITYSGNAGKATGEVGTTYTLPTVKLTFDDKGSYKYGSFIYNDENNKIRQELPNVSVLSAYIKQDDNNVVSSCSDISSTGDLLSLTITSNNTKFTDDISATAKTYTVTYYYETSTDITIPYDNIGGAAGDGSESAETNYKAYQIKSITSTKTETARTAQSWRSRFFGYMDGNTNDAGQRVNLINIEDLVNASNPTSDPVRDKLSTTSYSNKLRQYSSISGLPKSVEMTNMMQMFWIIPTFDGITEIIATDPLGSTISAKKFTDSTYVHGANNYSSIQYDIWYIDLAAPRTGTNEKFTIKYA